MANPYLVPSLRWRLVQMVVSSSRGKQMMRASSHLGASSRGAKLRDIVKEQRRRVFDHSNPKRLFLKSARNWFQAKQFAIDCATPLNLPTELDAILGDHFFAGSVLPNAKRIAKEARSSNVDFSAPGMTLID